MSKFCSNIATMRKAVKIKPKKTQKNKQTIVAINFALHRAEREPFHGSAAVVVLCEIVRGGVHGPFARDLDFLV